MPDHRRKHLIDKYLTIVLFWLTVQSLLGGPNSLKSSFPGNNSSAFDGIEQDITTLNIGRYTEKEMVILRDIQDRIDTIDQGGLYVLLDHAENILIDNSAIEQSISPSDLLKNPDEFRGGITHFDIFVDPEIKTAPLGRSRRDHVKYINAQIKTSNKLRFPSIILLPERIIQSNVDKMAVSGYFYMILRAQTIEPDPETGRKYLDYIVLVATELKPQTISQSVKPHNKLVITALALLMTVTVWMTLRFRINKLKRRGSINPTKLK